MTSKYDESYFDNRQVTHYVGDDCPGGHYASPSDFIASGQAEKAAMFQIKDSGQREQFDLGMVRDTNAGKTLWHLVADGPMLRRWAEHLTKGAIKYAARNWMLASGDAEYQRFRESAFRHFIQWFLGDRDEDHAAAVFFNINGAEYVRDQQPSGYTTTFEVEHTDAPYRCPMQCGADHEPCDEKQCYCEPKAP